VVKCQVSIIKSLVSKSSKGPRNRKIFIAFRPRTTSEAYDALAILCESSFQPPHKHILNPNNGHPDAFTTFSKILDFLSFYLYQNTGSSSLVPRHSSFDKSNDGLSQDSLNYNHKARYRIFNLRSHTLDRDEKSRHCHDGYQTKP
jgi:hypothetical protein